MDRRASRFRLASAGGFSLAPLLSRSEFDGGELRIAALRDEDGREVQRGDVVDLDGVEGTVAAVMTPGHFDPYLSGEGLELPDDGVLISTTTIGLVHVVVLDADDRLVRRGI